MPPKPDPNNLPSTQPLNAGTLIQLTPGQAKALIFGVIFCACVVTAAFVRHEYRTARIEEALDNGWTIHHQREWTHRIEKNNVGTIKVPNPDEIRALIKTR